MEEQQRSVLQVDQMGKLIHRLRSVSAAILLLCVFFSPNLPSADADELLVPETPVPVSPLSVEPLRVETDHAALVEQPVTAPGYWIVSSWKSPQNFDDGGLQFCPEVTRFDTGQGYRRAGIGDLTQSLVPGVPICVFVHGSFMDSPSVLPESCATWTWLDKGSCGLPFQMIYFSWPSDRHLTALASIDVAILGNRASRNGFYLASLIKQLPPESPVCLIGHSHGTRVISSSLHLLSGGDVEGHRHCSPGADGRRLRVVYFASAIDHDWLNPGERFDRALCCTECLVNVRNAKDPALMIYPLRRVGSSRALGFAGFTKKDRSELGSMNGKVRDWDVSEMVGHGHLWPNYVNRPGLACSLRNYFYFADSQTPVVASESTTGP